MDGNGNSSVIDCVVEKYRSTLRESDEMLNNRGKNNNPKRKKGIRQLNHRILHEMNFSVPSIFYREFSPAPISIDFLKCSKYARLVCDFSMVRLVLIALLIEVT